MATNKATGACDEDTKIFVFRPAIHEERIVPILAEHLANALADGPSDRAPRWIAPSACAQSQANASAPAFGRLARVVRVLQDQLRDRRGPRPEDRSEASV